MEPDRKDVAKARWTWRDTSYAVLLFLLGLVWVSGFPIIWWSSTGFVYLFAISGFSIAYAIHFFSISIGLNGVLLRSADPREITIRAVEHDIVGRGLCVLGGGLGILLAGGILLLPRSQVLNENFMIMFATGVYFVAGSFLVLNVWLYYFSSPRGHLRRHWPEAILRSPSGNLQEGARNAIEKRDAKDVVIMNAKASSDPNRPIAWCVKCDTCKAVDPWLRGARFRCQNSTIDDFHVAAVIPRELKWWLRLEALLVSATDCRCHPRVWLCRGYAELYGAFLLVVIVSALLLASRLSWLAVVLAAFVVVDLLAYNTRVAFITQHSQAPLRSAVYGVVGFAFIAGSFAALFLSLAPNDFKPQSLDVISAVYFSFVTLATLGYGDIYPKVAATGAQFMVIAAVLVGLFYVAGVLVTLVAWANGRPGLPTLEQLERRLNE